MNKHIHFFSDFDHVKDEDIQTKLGIRGRMAMELAAMDLPILPGFVIDADLAANLDKVDLRKELKPYLKKIEKLTHKTFDNAENPLVLKIVVCPNLAITNYPTLHNYGLSRNTIDGFNESVGEDFGYHEMEFLMRGNLGIASRIAENEANEKVKKEIDAAAKEIAGQLDINTSASKKKITVADRKKTIESCKDYLPEKFLDDSYSQLEGALSLISKLLRSDQNEIEDSKENDTAIMVQVMVYGNYGENSASGKIFTRNVVSGERVLQGQFYKDKFNEIGAKGNDINSIEPKFKKQLEKIARVVEDRYREIRIIRFVIENGKLWALEQQPISDKSTRADIRMLLDLLNRKVISKKEIVQRIKPSQLNELLHPVIDPASVKKYTSVEGGLAGAPGAAIGRVYFSTDRLLEAYKTAQQQGEDTRFLLCLPATFAEDVKAIEIANGVLSSEGGYAAHASVVARQYGKVSLVNTDLKISSKSASINGVSIKEGEVISLNVPYYGDPVIYKGEAGLIEPDPETSGLLDFVGLTKEFIDGFHVRVNADNPDGADLGLKFGADGIGLCRTEHMFFADSRINVFREMIIADKKSEREKSLKKLQKMQTKDFYDMFKIMKGRDVTIRLLDAPLHEFLPHNKDEMKEFIGYIQEKNNQQKISIKEIEAQCDAIKEFNPMLGHRGCRLAVTYPEIYEMQVRAIFEAVYRLNEEDISVHPEVMIPLVMNENELKLIVHGKKIEGTSYRGLLDIAEEVRTARKAKEVPYKIGTMIELPAAAMGAGEIAKYAEFFSFGTNDLTQTTIGLSRDDSNSFMPDYTQFDLLNGNPFQHLNPVVKELISIAVRRGVMTRPGLKKGLCGEHGAVPENIRFCMNAGLDYVSCSAYSVPIALLAVAQIKLEEE